MNDMKKVTAKIRQKAKIPIDEKGFPLFADSFFRWKNSTEVTEKQLITNGWVKLSDVSSMLGELEKTHKIIRKEDWDEAVSLSAKRAYQELKKTHAIIEKKQLRVVYDFLKERCVNHIWMGWSVGEVISQLACEWMDIVLDSEVIEAG